uniref:Uncharacterized protein n=1 Tax=Anguilla anguilla TaxID=7936 RepID=A0A0E9VQY4_ANGAN
MHLNVLYNFCHWHHLCPPYCLAAILTFSLGRGSFLR